MYACTVAYKFVTHVCKLLGCTYSCNVIKITNIKLVQIEVGQQANSRGKQLI